MLALGVALSAIAAIAAFAIGRSTGRTSREKELQAVRDQLVERDKGLAVAESRLAALGDTSRIKDDVIAAVTGPVMERNSRQFLELAETRFKTLQHSTEAELEARRTAIETLVAPLGQSLKDLGGKLSEIEKGRIEAYSQVTAQLTALASANNDLRLQTGNLVKALRSPNVRGNWGQVQLRRTVEIAGMIERCDFFEQVSVDTEDGRLRPDMIVRLPADRQVVVDAKVPLMAYLESIEAPTEEARAGFLKTHAAQVRTHITQLSSKKYAAQFEPAPEFVVMFLPVEALFAAALQQDATLLEFGAEHGVIPASPLTLIALLRAVNYGWKEASLARDAAEIRDLGRGLYDAVRVLAGHLTKMRDSLENTVDAFNKSVGSVERSFLTRARKLKDLNAGGDEPIPIIEPIDERLRALEAAELRQGSLDSIVEGLEFDGIDRKS